VLRSARSRPELTLPPRNGGSRPSPREVLLAVAPPPENPAYALSGWPDWLTPRLRLNIPRPKAKTEPSHERSP
jgi:hypothetical protein